MEGALEKALESYPHGRGGVGVERRGGEEEGWEGTEEMDQPRAGWSEEQYGTPWGTASEDQKTTGDDPPKCCIHK